MNVMVSIFRNMKLRNKIVLFTIALLLISILITGTLIYNQAAMIIRSNVTDRNSEITEQSAAFMDEKMRSLLDQVQFIQTTESFKDAIESIYEGYNSDYEQIYTQLHALTSRISMSESFVTSIQIDTPAGIFYDTVLRDFPEEVYEKDKAYFDRIRERNQKGSLAYWGNGRDLNPSDNTLPLLLSVPQWDSMMDFEELAILVKLNQGEMITYLEDVGAKMNSEIYILDHRNDLVISTDKQAFIGLLANDTVKKMNEMDLDNVNVEDDNHVYTVSRSGFSLNGWQMLAITKEEDILKSLQQIRLISYAVIALITIVSVVISILISRSITKPLKVLRKTMMSAQESDFDVQIMDESKSEIGDLSRTFNKMSAEIKYLLEEIRLGHEQNLHEQKLKRQAELKVLNEQINPHFLYNALDSIYWRSAKAGNEEVAKMALSLSNVFRIGLNKGKEMTTLNREIEHVSSYLELQKIIYHDKFDYKVIGPKDCNDIKVIKLILQPLVENSIVHGFENLTEGGEIDVIITVTDEEAEYCVKDNGCGFDAILMQKILADETDDYEGYALGNIYRRLKLNYGDALVFELRSEPDVLTEITIRLPLEK